MDPIIGGSLILAGSSLIGGLMGAAVSAQDRKKQMEMLSRQQAFEAQSEGAKSLGKNQQSAFQQLMEAYKSSLT